MCPNFFRRKLHPDGATLTSSVQPGHTGWKTGRGPVLSFAVATHHLLAEIRASRQNIKKADIYWGSTCVFSVDLITEFCHFSLPPISFRCQPRHCRRSYLWRIPELPTFGAMERTGVRGSQSRGNKRENDRERFFIPSCWVSGVSKQCHGGANARRDSAFHVSCADTHEQTERERESQR